MFKGVITTLALALFVIVGPAQAADPIYTGAFSNKAVGGYDTVAYHTENKAVKGSKEFSTIWKSASWYRHKCMFVPYFRKKYCIM